MGTPPESGAAATPPPAVVAAEQRVREHLAQGQWRKARDEAKPLTKLDRPRYLPLLLKANIGLAHEMTGKGQTAEAQQVLAHLSGLAPAEQLRALEIELFGGRPSDQHSLERAITALTVPEANRAEKDTLRLADEAVAAFQPIEGDDPARVRVVAEIRAIQDALLAVSLGQGDRAVDRLRSVPHRSPFRHWVVFVKGLLAFHAGDDDRAVRCFDLLPEGSVPGRASQPYLWLADRLGRKLEGKGPSDALVEGACRLVGHAGLGRSLRRADELWKRHRFDEAYRVLRDAVPGFPAQTLDPLGSLTEFFFQAPLAMSFDDRDDFLAFGEELIEPGISKNGVEAMLWHRLWALVAAAQGERSGLRRDWEEFLRLHQQLHGPTPRLASIAYSWLGEQIAQPRFSPFGFGTSPQLEDPQGALACLQRSVQLDPDNLPAYLRLGGLYGLLGKTRERNKLLDEMTVRFPDDKRVLLEAGKGCIERQAYRKGLDYFERARHLDRLDPVIPDGIALARYRLARHHFEQRRADSGREMLAPLEDLLTDKPEDFHRARWTVQVRHGLLERLHGDPARADALLASAQASAPFPAAFALFAQVAHRVYTGVAQQASPLLGALTSALREAPGVGHAAALVRILEYWSRASERPDLQREEDLVRKYAKAAARRTCTRDEARQLAELKLGDFTWKGVLRPLVKQALRQDPHDPLFRFYEYSLEVKWPPGSAKARPRLQQMLQEADRRHDDQTAQKVRRALKDLDRPPLPPLPPLPPRPTPESDFDNGGGAGDGEWADDWEDLASPPPDDLLPIDVPEQFAGQMASLIEMLQGLPPAEIRRMSRDRPKDIPKRIIDSLIKAATSDAPRTKPAPARPTEPAPPPPPQPPQQQQPSQPPPPKPFKLTLSPEPPPTPTPKPPAPEPRQMDLF